MNFTLNKPQIVQSYTKNDNQAASIGRLLLNTGLTAAVLFLFLFLFTAATIVDDKNADHHWVGIEPYISTVKLFAFNYPPSGWHICEKDGWSLVVSNNEDLYKVIGNAWGGDDQEFYLPGMSPLKTENSGYDLKYYMAISGKAP